MIQNYMTGKKISILGDSISTLDGYILPGYSSFYSKGQYGIYDMNDTWWGIVINTFGASFLVNNSWSGSRVTCIPGSAVLFPSASSKERTGGLHFGGMMPDVILIYMGTNDWGYGATLRKKMTRRDSGFPEMIFENAYRLMLKRLRNNYPNAVICCITINPAYIPMEPSFCFPNEYYGCDFREFNSVIKSEAELAGAYFLNVADQGMPYETIDGIHPDMRGMRTLADGVIRELSRYFG
ncbi:GDSL-like Lipase/Acylhydrolase [Eubacterium ruminantium]|nr:GDSL-like Lipase/Acylhydrolase [Eubacterium ruminantium]